MWLNGNGISSNTLTCYVRVYAETFKLIPHWLGRTVARLNTTHIVLCSIEAIIKPNEQELLHA
jgi:hypothetical protein